MPVLRRKPGFEEGWRWREARRFFAVGAAHFSQMSRRESWEAGIDVGLGVGLSWSRGLVVGEVRARGGGSDRATCLVSAWCCWFDLGLVMVVDIS